MKNSAIPLEVQNNQEEKHFEKVVDTKLGNIFFKCKVCGKKRTSRPVIKSHLLSVHDHKELIFEKVFNKCTKCAFVSGQFIKIVRHMKIVHNTIELYSKCQLCTLKTETIYELNKHVNDVHLKIKSVCEQCGYKARRMSTIKTHKLTAHEGMVFSCDLCSFTTKSERTSITHTKNVHKEVWCTLCQIYFKGLTKLFEHSKREHEGKIVDCFFV